MSKRAELRRKAREKRSKARAIVDAREMAYAGRMERLRLEREKSGEKLVGLDDLMQIWGASEPRWVGDSMTNIYDKMTQEEFEETLIEIVNERETPEGMLLIPGVHEVVAEHYNNDVLDR